MSIKDRLKELKSRIEQKKPDAKTVLPDLSAAPQTQQASPKPGASPVVGTEIVQAKCGHHVDFHLFEAKKDKFREQRRAKITDRDCPARRQAQEQQRQQEAQQRKAEQPEGTEGKRKRGPGWKKEAGARLARLPHGSRFDVAYDADTQTWTGTLTLVSVSPPQVFTATEGGVFRLLSNLDALYRDWQALRGVEGA